MTQLLTVGAALQAETLPRYLDWILSAQRDLEIQDAMDVRHFDRGTWRTLAREIRAMLDGYTGRLSIHGPFVDLTIAPYDPKIAAVVVERLLHGVDFAQAVGASQMVLHSPFISFNREPNPPTHLYEQAQDVLADVVARAAQANCTLVIENVFSKRPDYHAEFVRAFDSDFVRASVDTGHARLAQTGGGPSPADWLNAMGDMLAHVHLHDNAGQVDNHHAAGDGDIDWQAVFAVLAERDPTPRLIIEALDPDNITRTADYLARQRLAR